MSYQIIFSPKRIINLFSLCVFLLLSTVVYGQDDAYLNRHKEDFDKVFKYFFEKSISDLEPSMIVDIKTFPKPIYNLETSRQGSNSEDVVLTLEVFMISDFKLGDYNNELTNRVFSTMTNIINENLGEKEDKYLQKIRITGSCEGVADAHQVGPRLLYNGEYGMLNDIEYRDISQGVGKAGFGQKRAANIKEGQEISNLELAFLRAYNIQQQLEEQFGSLPQVFDPEDFAVYAIDEKTRKGYEYRKVYVRLVLEDFYLDKYEEQMAYDQR